ncbi:MAG TPA: hypothetical protein VGN88_06510 [Phycisphaerae bacterium]
MKAEERHELRENDLASWLQYGLWAFLKQNGSYVLLVLALAFLGYQLWNMYETKQELAVRGAWLDLQNASTVDDPIKALGDVIDTSTVNAVKAEGSLELANIYERLIVNPEMMDKRRESRDEVLGKAFMYYNKALETMGDDKLIAANAHLGLAAVLEDRAEWDKAKAEYQILTDPNGKFKGTAFQELAADRIKTLDERRNVPRLASMIPPPPPPSTPSSGLPQLPGGSGLGLPGGMSLPSGLGLPIGGGSQGIGSPGGTSIAPSTQGGGFQMLPPLLGPPTPLIPLPSNNTAPPPASPFGAPSMPEITPTTTPGTPKTSP